MCHRDSFIDERLTARLSLPLQQPASTITHYITTRNFVCPGMSRALARSLKYSMNLFKSSVIYEPVPWLKSFRTKFFPFLSFINGRVSKHFHYNYVWTERWIYVPVPLPYWLTSIQKKTRQRNFRTSLPKNELVCHIWQQSWLLWSSHSKQGSIWDIYRRFVWLHGNQWKIQGQIQDLALIDNNVIRNV